MHGLGPGDMCCGVPNLFQMQAAHGVIGVKCTHSLYSSNARQGYPNLSEGAAPRGRGYSEWCMEFGVQRCGAGSSKPVQSFR